VAPGNQGPPVAASDDVGGVIVAWQDSRAGGDGADIYAVRLTAAGARAPGWDANGTALCTQPGEQAGPWVVPDGLSGAVVAWTDSRSNVRFQTPDIYATKTIDDLPVAVRVSLVSATAEPAQVRIEWRVPAAGVSAEVWRRAEGGDWLALGTIVSSGDGRLAFEDHSIMPGATYDYRLGLVGIGDVGFGGEVRVTVPSNTLFALDGARPNPATDGLTVSFALPDDAPAMIEVLDIAGRVLASQPVGTLGGGRHVVRMDADSALRPGVYYIRLTRAGHVVTARAAVTR
jgi:hypothetical protein